jgi:glycosyltransferase involved in cell wall biosynthesis
MGGAQYQIKELLSSLRTLDRYDIHYVARRVPEEAELDGYSIHRIGRGGPMPSFGFAMDAPRLYRLLQKLKPDVIYQRIGCAYTGIAAYYARRSGARLVWHAANDSDLDRSIRTVGRNFIRERLETALLYYGIRHADRIVVQTQRQARLLHDRFRRSPDAVVANFHPAATEISNSSGPPRVVWVANIKRSKRPDAFLRLAESLRSLTGVRFIMIGAPPDGVGDTAWSASLMRSIADAPNVDYLGELTQAEVNAELARAYVFVNTSLYEGFPNTFIQAWLRAVPVVSLGINPDGVLDRQTTGLLAASEHQLAQIIRQLIEDRPFRDRLARGAIAHATEFHSMRNAQQLEQIIHSAAFL